MADTISITRKGFVALMSEVMRGYPQPDDSSPPGPWDPIIRKALNRIRWASGSAFDAWNRAALNPQPLPPRFAFALALAREMVDHVSSTYASSPGSPCGPDDRNPATTRLFQFVDDCGNGRIRRHWPWPWPPHGNEQDVALSPNELIVIGMQFEDATFETTDESLRRDFSKAGAKLVEMGLSRI